MPRYYFDTNDGRNFIRDEFGKECITRNEIRKAALAVLPSMALDEMMKNEHHDFSVDVRDGNDKPVFRATLSIAAEWLNGEI